MHIVHVAVAGPFIQAFDYLLPKDWPPPPIGGRVWVSVRNKDQIGIVLGFSSESHVPVEKLKWLVRPLDTTPLFDSHHQRFITWCAAYYHAPLGDMYQAAMPALLRTGALAAMAPVNSLRLSEQGLTATSLTAKQTLICSELAKTPQGMARGQLLALGVSASALKTLITKGMVDAFNQLPPAALVTLAPALTANTEQQLAINTITQALGQYHSILLFGVTGSGKTEVYLQSIAAVLARGEQALVLVPEIGLTPQTVARFVHRFGACVVAMHSALSERERLDAWLAAQSGQIRVIIGTRSALLVPFKNLGLIIVDEEHDASFKQQSGIRYNARDAAIARAYQLKIPVVLGSATPSLETWFNVTKARYRLLRLTMRTMNATEPTIQLIDLRSKPWAHGLSTVLQEAIRHELGQGNQVLLFLNRRGFSVSLLCHQCGWSPHCARCDSALTCHTTPFKKLACHHCGHESKWRYACKACQYPLAPVGTGTQRLSETLKNLFPDVPLLRIDRDSTKHKGSFAAMLADINTGKAQILVGTQMLAKGHHFPNVTLVGILNADSGLYSSDFRSPERLAQLIIQVAGRAGREQKPGKVYIQTLWPDHPMLQQLLHGGYEAFLNVALSERERATLPPYRFVALFGAETTTAQQALVFLTLLRDYLHEKALPGLSILGPVPALKEKRAGFYRGQLWLQSTERHALAQAIEQVNHYLSVHTKEARKFRCFMDIDPYQLD